MSNGPYFVRWRGKVQGPYSLEELSRLYQMGQVTKFHSISIDQAVWTSAGELQALNPSTAGISVAEQTVSTVSPIPTAQVTQSAPAPMPVAPSIPVYTEPQVTEAQGRSGKTFLIAGAAVVALVLAVGTFLYFTTAKPLQNPQNAEADALTDAAHAPSDSLAVLSLAHPDKSLKEFIDQIGKDSNSPGAKDVRATVAEVKETTKFDIFNLNHYVNAGIDLSHPISIVVQREVQGLVITAWAIDDTTPISAFRKICDAQGTKIVETGTNPIIYSVPNIIEMTVVKGRIVLGLPLSRFAVDGVIKPFLQERDNPPLADSDDFKAATGVIQRNGDFAGYFSLTRFFEMLPSWVRPPKVINEVRGISFSTDKLVSSAHILFAKSSHLVSDIDGRQTSSELLGRMGKPMMAMTFSLKSIDDFGRRLLGSDWEIAKHNLCDAYGIPSASANSLLSGGTYGLALYPPAQSVKEPRSVFFIRVADTNAAVSSAKQSLERFGAVQRNDYGRNPKTDSGKNIVMSSSTTANLAYAIIDNFLLVSNDVELLRKTASTTEQNWQPEVGGSQIFGFECSIQQCLRLLRSYPDFAEHMKDSPGSELVMRRLDDLSQGDAHISVLMKNGGSGLTVSSKLDGADLGRMTWMGPLFVADLIGEARARAHLQQMAKPVPLELARPLKPIGPELPNFSSPTWIETPNASKAAGMEWQPVIEMDRIVFPAYIIATATMKEQRETHDPQVIGDPEGLFGVRVRGYKAGSRIKIELKANDFMEASVAEETMPREGASLLIKPKINYKFEKLRQNRQLTPVTLAFLVYENNVLLGEKHETLSLRSINDCPIRMLSNNGHTPFINLAWLFAAYVNEDHPEVQKILAEAMKTNHIQAITGYQSNQVFEQVEAVWHALANRGIKYSNITNTPGYSDKIASQHVRLIDESLNSEQANCVDGSVLFASILRKMGIDTYLVLMPNHCFVGFYLDSGKTKSYCIETTVLGETDLKNKNYSKLDPDRAEQIRSEVSTQVLMYAINSATQRMEQNFNNPNYVRVDIEDARAAGIAPIPFVKAK